MLSQRKKSKKTKLSVGHSLVAFLEKLLKLKKVMSKSKSVAI
jgi:hypothetical protein